MSQRGHVGAIDGLRAIAVLAVVIYHMGVQPSSMPDWADCGIRGVDLFFVISGFCLAYPFLRKIIGGEPLKISLSMFVARRIGRIGPPYWIALFLLALLSLTSFGLPTLSSHPAAMSALSELGFDAIFLTNRAPIFDSSFWTLGIEMRWYLLFPLLLRLYASSRVAFVAVALVCYMLYFFTPASIADEGTLPCFMLGIVAADLVLRRHPTIPYVWPLAVVTLGYASWEQAHNLSGDLANPLWHLAAFFSVLLVGDERFARVLRTRPLAFIGVSSYSIYLVHEPILESLRHIGLPVRFAALLAIAGGIAFYEVIERRSLRPKFRAKVENTILLPLRIFRAKAADLRSV